ncbi:MAG: C1 family peptidase [Cryomorphaceae bacterium]|nr:C1 family peptidase [Cryomorphaceae bacterium]
MKITFPFLALFLSFSLTVLAQDDLVKKVYQQNEVVYEQGYRFTEQIALDVLPIKNQASSGTCWSYATTSFVESEMLRLGKKPVDLSEMFTVRQVYKDKAERYVRLHGHLNFAQGGATPDVLYVLKKYGAVPYFQYKGLEYGEEKNKHNELENVLKNMLDAVIKNPNGRLSTAWKGAVESTLNAYLGDYPESFKYEGKTYTPRSFADQVVGIKPDDYIQITSFVSDEMYANVFIEVPDNWAWATAFNLPLEEMMNNLDNALDNGYTVSWATDVSEKGFSVRNGLAIVPAKPFDEMSDEEKKAVFQHPTEELTITEEMRQRAYDNFETTDDHGMHIVGRSIDQNGTKYYLVKNSWGEIENPYKNGYIYCSESFVRYKTISLMMHKDALTKKTKRRIP